MPPPGYEPFLRAICADPEDDTVRLVYADWLDENGDPERAEFIRLQIEYEWRRAARTCDSAFWGRYTAMVRNEGGWRHELPRLPGISWPGFFRRGFPHEVAVSDGRHLVRNGEAVFEATPVDTVSVAGAGLTTLTRVLERPEVNRVSRLWLHHCRLAPGEWEIVAQCPYLTRLDFLGLAPPFRPSLRRANWTLLTDADARAMVASPFLPRGMELHLVGWVSPEAAALLRARFAVVDTLTPPGSSPSA
jgi:uncharacterized protein (TIGR02996 family)